MAQLMVRSFITKGAKLSRVTYDTPNFRILSQSGRAYANASKSDEKPLLERIDRVKDKTGMYLDIYEIDGVKIYSGFDKNATEGHTPNVFIMDTAEAEKRHVPYDNKPVTEVELDFGDITEEVASNDNALELKEVE